MEKYVKQTPAQIHQNNDAEMREDVKLGMPLSSSYIRSLIRPYSIRDREKNPEMPAWRPHSAQLRILRKN